MASAVGGRTPVTPHTNALRHQRTRVSGAWNPATAAGARRRWWASSLALEQEQLEQRPHRCDWRNGPRHRAYPPNQMVALRNAGFRRLILDLSCLEFIDSTGLRCILECDAEARRDGSALIPGSQAVQRVFELTKCVGARPSAVRRPTRSTATSAPPAARRRSSASGRLSGQGAPRCCRSRGHRRRRRSARDSGHRGNPTTAGRAARRGPGRTRRPRYAGPRRSPAAGQAGYAAGLV